MIPLQIDTTPAWLTKAIDQGGAITMAVIVAGVIIWCVKTILPELRAWVSASAARRQAADDQARSDRKEAEAAERKAYADRIDEMSRQMKSLKPLIQENTEVTRENTAAKTGDLPSPGSIKT